MTLLLVLTLTLAVIPALSRDRMPPCARQPLFAPAHVRTKRSRLKAGTTEGGEP